MRELCWSIFLFVWHKSTSQLYLHLRSQIPGGEGEGAGGGGWKGEEVARWADVQLIGCRSVWQHAMGQLRYLIIFSFKGTVSQDFPVFFHDFNPCGVWTPHSDAKIFLKYLRIYSHMQNLGCISGVKLCLKRQCHERVGPFFIILIHLGPFFVSWIIVADF